MIFHSYVNLPEGNGDGDIATSYLGKYTNHGCNGDIANNNLGKFHHDRSLFSRSLGIMWNDG